MSHPSAFTGTDWERLAPTIAVREEIRARVRRWVDVDVEKDVDVDKEETQPPFGKNSLVEKRK